MSRPRGGRAFTGDGVPPRGACARTPPRRSAVLEAPLRRPGYPFFARVSVQSRPFSITATISSISGFVMMSGGEMKM